MAGFAPFAFAFTFSIGKVEKGLGRIGMVVVGGTRLSCFDFKSAAALGFAIAVLVAVAAVVSLELANVEVCSWPVKADIGELTLFGGTALMLLLLLFVVEGVERLI